jgi:hypothetical protein
MGGGEEDQIYSRCDMKYVGEGRRVILMGCGEDLV